MGRRSGYSLDMEFCAGLLKDADVVDINSALRESSSLPIYRRGEHLLLRHETLASWYLDDEDEKLRANRRNSEEIFKAFLEKIETEFARNLFIWACIKNRDFRKSYLARLVDDSKRMLILESFIEQHPAELKCRTELSKIYQRQKRWQEAENVLLESLKIDAEQLHPRTELSITRVYEILRDRKQVEHYIARGEAILREDRYNKHEERFSRFNPWLDEEISLRSLNEIGIAILENERRYVENQSGRYVVHEQATVNNQIEPNAKVFFALYARGQEVYADFIEPYFENIDDLERLR
jgi:hypothetical protein